MDFAFTEEQELLRETAREFLSAECPITRVRELMEAESGFDRDLWSQIAELGWIGLPIPEQYGGSGLGFLELAILLEEMGRALLPSPFHANLQGSLTVLRGGSEAQREQILPAVVDGERILSLAVGEQRGREAPAELTSRAARDGSVYRLTGSKRFVPDAQNADTLVVAARTDGDAAGAASLLLVERAAPGVEVTALESIDATRRIADVRFDGAPAELLGETGRAQEVWSWVHDRILIAIAADALGGCEKTLEDAVSYAKEREQFGRPIGVHQAVKHRCADMLIDVEACRSLTYDAAWAAAEELEETTLAAAMAKAYTGDAYRRCSAENIQIHGGVGFTWEYDCHLYFRRAKALEVTYGDPVLQRERVASLLDL
jgi:alkylation response protein AidB-like acyl-CoA dehydrogenase